MPEYIDIEVAYARPGKQLIVPLNVPAGTTIEKAIALSRIAQKFTEIDPGKLVVGIFGKRAKLDHRLADGERIEIYRPLKADPREIRRQLAAQGKTMGKARKTDQKPDASSVEGSPAILSKRLTWSPSKKTTK